MARAARTAAARPSTPCPRSSKPCAAASRCWSTAGSGAAPISSRAWPSARARCASAGPTSGAWAPSASPASSACSSSCAPSCRRRCSNAACARSGSSRRRSCAGRPEREAALLRRRSDRLAFLDDIGGEHLRRAAADVLAIVHLAGFDEESVARFQRPGRLAVDFEQQRSFDDVAELLAGIRVPARRTAGDEFRQRLHRMALRQAQVLVLQQLAREPRLLGVPEHGDCGDENCSGHCGFPGFHDLSSGKRGGIIRRQTEGSSQEVAMRPALVLLLLVTAASCTTERQYSSYGMSAGYPAAATPAQLDAARSVAEQDCTKPIMLDRGNLLCR